MEDRTSPDFDFSQLLTKADLLAFEARMKAWSLGLTLLVITVNGVENLVMYYALKSLLVTHAG